MADPQPSGALPPFPECPGVQFRAIPDADLFAASSDGRIWTCKKYRSSFREVDSKWRFVKPYLSRNGYLSVNINRCPVHVHVLILRTFIGPRPTNMLCRHLDGNSLNNNLENIVWGTPKENVMDTFVHRGMFPGEHGRSTIKGVSVHRTMIDEATVNLIREMAARGVTQTVIANKFDVSQTYVSAIVRGIIRASPDSMDADREPKYKRINADLLEIIVSLRGKGLSQKEIGEVVGYSQRAISKALRRYSST